MDTPSKKELFNFFGFIIVMYIYIYQPPVIPKIIYPLSEFFIFFLYAFTHKAFLNGLLRTFKSEVLLLVLIVFYTILRDIVSLEVVYSDRFILWSFQSFFFAFLIVHVFANYNKKRKHKIKVNLFNIVYWTVFFAGIGTVLLLLNKPFDTFYQSIPSITVFVFISF